MFGNAPYFTYYNGKMWVVSHIPLIDGTTVHYVDCYQGDYTGKGSWSYGYHKSS